MEVQVGESRGLDTDVRSMLCDVLLRLTEICITRFPDSPHTDGAGELGERERDLLRSKAVYRQHMRPLPTLALSCLHTAVWCTAFGGVPCAMGARRWAGVAAVPLLARGEAGRAREEPAKEGTGREGEGAERSAERALQQPRGVETGREGRGF